MAHADLQDAPWAPPRAVAQGAAVAGIGHSLPAGIVDSAEIEARLGLAAGWITRRTGINARRIATPADSLVEHSAVAGRMALEAAGVDPLKVDLVLVATTTNDVLLPSAAPMVATAVGATNAGGFDIGAACTGFLSGVAAGAGWIESGRASCVLVIGADFMSRITDPMDRGTAAVFADGAGAAVLTATSVENSRIGPVVLGSSGDLESSILVRHAAEPHIEMDGHETFRHAVLRLSESTVAAVRAAELALSDIELFVYHQANSRILSAVAETLKIDSDRVINAIADLGNTSAATLPLALVSAQQAGRLNDGAMVLLGAFGAGLTWGATVVRWGR